MSYVSSSMYGKVLCHASVHSGCVSNNSDLEITVNTCMAMLEGQNAFHGDIWILSGKSQRIGNHTRFVVYNFQFKRSHTFSRERRWA